MVGRARPLDMTVALRIAGRSLWKPLLIASAVMALAFAVASAALLAYGWTYGQTVYRGVRVAGVDVGGLTPGEAQARLEQQFAQYARGRIALVADDRTYDVAVSELGATPDFAATVERAYRYGRTGNLWKDSASWFRALVFGHDLPVVVTLDQEALVRVLEPLASQVARQPRDAAFAVDETGTVVITPAQPGLGVDVAATYRALQHRVAALSAEPVALALVDLEPTVTMHDLEPLLPRAEAMFGQPLMLEGGVARWQVAPRELLQFAHVRPSDDGTLVIAFDRQALEAYVTALAAQSFTAPVDASVRWEDGRFVVVPPVDGYELDPAATADAIIAGIESGRHLVEVRLAPVPARVTLEMAQAAAAEAQRIASRPVTVTWEGGSAELSPDQLASALVFAPQEEQGTVVGLAVEVDRERLAELLSPLQDAVQAAPQDAELRYYDGQVRVVKPEQPGRELDVEASVDAVRQAILDGRSEVALAVRAVEPQVTAATASQIVIRELISSGQTYYGGSVPNRKHNVELATERANGALVPPGGTFSFIETVGEINLETGYKVGYGIVATNGRVSTVPSVGGGVCQVSTTLFHAAFWGGFPIVERNWHLYWIPLYGQPPSGITGLDATVDTDYGLDFKFKNATDDWIAIVASADGEWVRFEIWGTKPDWRVEVDDPVVSNVVKADPAPVFRESPDLAPGQQVVVEQARDGFDVVIHRRVYQGDRLIDELLLRSHYMPSSNVTLVGPNPDEPAADGDSQEAPPFEPVPEPTEEPQQ